jgi:hypothetical protein
VTEAAVYSPFVSLTKVAGVAVGIAEHEIAEMDMNCPPVVLSFL